MSTNHNDTNPGAVPQAETVAAKRPDLTGIGNRARLASRGPWAKYNSPYPSMIGLKGPRLYITGVLFATDTPDDQYQQVMDDADFIAYAREDIPALVAWIRTLESAVQNLNTEWGHQLEKADAMIVSLQEENRNLAAQLHESGEAL